MIEVKNISKEFKIYKREKGFVNGIKSLVKPEYEIKKAVKDISFNIDKGELVGYIGPNGAGKSTTIKMLSGILFPSEGEVLINGKIPHKNRKQNAMDIGVVFGQRSQLFWDLPMDETFELYKKMYKIEDSRYKRNVDFYIELLEMQEFVKTPVRQLSLGQKMRANIAVALLHDPQIVYLDEPTIGLDVVAKDRIRKFIREVNKEKQTTLMITTHDMDDIEQICDRVIMIDKGQKLYDGTIENLKDTYYTGSMLIVDFENEQVKLEHDKIQVVKEEGRRKWLLYRKEEISTTEAIKYITQRYDILELNLSEPDIEDVVREMYSNRKNK